MALHFTHTDRGKTFVNAYRKIHNLFIPTVFISIFIFTSACSGSLAPSNPSSESPIEKNMRAFYNKLGGKNLLGDILSPVLSEDDFYYQFTEKVILVFEPQAPTPKQYHLHPVGLEMGFQEPPEPMPADPNTVYINGFVVWPEALDLYNHWGRICKPISALHYNEEYKRFEQFFDCFGVYRLEDDPVGTIHLLDYGAWKCGSACTSYSPSSSGFIPQTLFPEPPTKQDLEAAEAIIIKGADRIGRAVTGFPLTPTYLSDDGKLYLKIYENVVFAVERENTNRAYVLAITRSLNIQPGTTKPEIKEPGAKFIQINGDLGYTVRSDFNNFLTLHGSNDTSGLPITNEYTINTTVTRQCFENLCLDYHQKAGSGLKVRVAPLGYIYKELYYRQDIAEPAPITVNSNITIHPWEGSSMISSDQSQEISAAVYENFVPVPDVQVILSVRMPDETWVEYEPKSTDQKGQVTFTIPPLEAPNGTIILYQVCLYGIAESKNFCVMEDFTIWGNP